MYIFIICEMESLVNPQNIIPIMIVMVNMLFILTPLKIGIAMENGMMRNQEIRATEFGMMMKPLLIQIVMMSGTQVSLCIGSVIKWKHLS